MKWVIQSKDDCRGFLFYPIPTKTRTSWAVIPFERWFLCVAFICWERRQRWPEQSWYPYKLKQNLHTTCYNMMYKISKTLKGNYFYQFLSSLAFWKILKYKLQIGNTSSNHFCRNQSSALFLSWNFTKESWNAQFVKDPGMICKKSWNDFLESQFLQFF